MQVIENTAETETETDPYTTYRACARLGGGAQPQAQYECAA